MEAIRKDGKEGRGLSHFFPSLHPSLPLKEGNDKHLSWTGVAVTVESEVESESDLDQI